MREWTSKDTRELGMRLSREVVEAAEQELGKSREDFTRDEWISFVFDRVRSSTSAYTLLRAYLFESLKTEEARAAVSTIAFSEVNHTAVLLSEYFATYNDLMDYVEDGVKQTAKERKADIHSFDITLVTVTLAWFGLTCEEARNVRKSDFLTRVHILKVGDKRTIRLPDRAYTYIKDFIELPGFKVNNGNRQTLNIIPLVDSPYLLRTQRSSQISMLSLKANITRHIKETTKRVTYDSVYWSGVFSRAYEYECKHGRVLPPSNRQNAPERDAWIAKIRTLMGDRFTPKDGSMILRYQQYQSYRRVFHPDDK